MDNEVPWYAAVPSSRNAGAFADLPHREVGFLLADHPRRALREGGGFDDEAISGRGYGEEVDFCMRASRAGLRNLLCEDLLCPRGRSVLRQGGAAMRQARRRASDERYPEFQPTVLDFIEASRPSAPPPGAA
jgi:hypothetical protein